MTAISRLGKQITEVTTALRGIDASFALIGGLALASHNECAAEGGVHAQVDPPDDPYRELDDLMAVVEQLCPRWPDRDIFRNEERSLL